MNIDNDKILGAYAVAVMDDGRKVVEVMNINQLKKAWNQRMGGLKEDASSTHMKFKDQMAKKTVINRLCKLIGNTSTDGNISEISDRLDEVAEVDMVAEDVAYEIENNANQIDFSEVVEPQDEQATPDFMKEQVQRMKTGNIEQMLNEFSDVVEPQSEQATPDFMNEQE